MAAGSGCAEQRRGLGRLRQRPGLGHQVAIDAQHLGFRRFVAAVVRPVGRKDESARAQRLVAQRRELAGLAQHVHALEFHQRVIAAQPRRPGGRDSGQTGIACPQNLGLPAFLRIAPGGRSDPRRSLERPIQRADDRSVGHQQMPAGLDVRLGRRRLVGREFARAFAQPDDHRVFGELRRFEKLAPVLGHDAQFRGHVVFKEPPIGLAQGDGADQRHRPRFGAPGSAQPTHPNQPRRAAPPTPHAIPLFPSR